MFGEINDKILIKPTVDPLIFCHSSDRHKSFSIFEKDLSNLHPLLKFELLQLNVKFHKINHYLKVFIKIIYFIQLEI